MNKDKKFVVVLKPNGRETFISMEEVSKTFDLDEMYKHCECRCIGIGHFCKDAAKALNKSLPLDLIDMFGYKTLKPCFIYDDEGLLVDNPQVNYVGSMLYGGTICGNIVVACERIDDEGELNTFGFNFGEAKFMEWFCKMLNGMVVESAFELVTPEPSMEFRSFDNLDEMINFVKEKENK